MPSATFRDKLGRTEQIEVRAGQPVTEVLRAAGIPVNGVITRVNGEIVPEELSTVGPDDHVEFSQVRHYDLAVTRNPARRTYGAPNAAYVKSVLFDQQGELEVRSEQYDRDTFPRYVEQVFVQSILSRELIRPGERIVIGLSGGRDSVSFLKLLERTREALPPFEMTAVTITGLPDWDEPATFEAAQEACRGLGIAQRIVTGEEVEETFRLRVPLVEAMTRVLAGERGSTVMVIAHHILRRMLERAAEDQDATSVAFGLNADDLVASLVTWYTSGFRMGGIPVREVAGRRFFFPLYRITKKELTLYLELTAPELNRQGTPGRFTTGPQERSMAYAVTDHLYDLWPGIDYYLFDAFTTMQAYAAPAEESRCQICGTSYLLVESMPNPSKCCDVCDIFLRQELVRPA